jgi:hypothetical protein
MQVLRLPDGKLRRLARKRTGIIAMPVTQKNSGNLALPKTTET